MTQHEYYVAQYLSNLGPISDSLRAMESVLTSTLSDGAKVMAPLRTRFEIAMRRVVKLQTGDDIPTFAAHPQIEAYILLESEADQEYPWRIAASIKRIYLTLTAGITIVHSSETEEEIARGYPRRLEELLPDIQVRYVAIARQAQKSTGNTVGDVLRRELLARLGKIMPPAQGISPLLAPDRSGVDLFEDVMNPALLFAQCDSILAP